MSWPTVRRHPRTLAEAFPQCYADPIEHHRNSTRRMFDACKWLTLALFAGTLGAIALGAI